MSAVQSPAQWLTVAFHPYPRRPGAGFGWWAAGSSSRPFSPFSSSETAPSLLLPQATLRLTDAHLPTSSSCISMCLGPQPPALSLFSVHLHALGELVQVHRSRSRLYGGASVTLTFTLTSVLPYALPWASQMGIAGHFRHQTSGAPCSPISGSAQAWRPPWSFCVWEASPTGSPLKMCHQ